MGVAGGSAAGGRIWRGVCQRPRAAAARRLRAAARGAAAGARAAHAVPHAAAPALLQHRARHARYSRLSNAHTHHFV